MRQPPFDEEGWDEPVDDDSDELDTDEQGVLFWNNPSAAVPLADSGQFLLIDGPDAGKISEDGRFQRGDQGPAPALLSRDDALDGTRPIFLVHRGGQHHKLLPNVIAHLHRDVGEDIALGAILRVPGQTTQNNEDFFAKCGAAAIRIADPYCYAVDTDALSLPKEFLSESAKGRVSYLEALGSNNWITLVLDSQRQSGANLLLTPGNALNVGDAEHSLKTLFDEAEEALSLLNNSERLALNITVSAPWLTSDDLRTTLLDELVDHDEYQIWYVRVQWRPQRSYTQLSNENLLTGYKRLAELATDEERILLLPQTGLTGWLMLAFGSKGFGVGSSGVDQAFLEPSYARGKGAARRERYLERQLIHTAERSVHDVLCTLPDYEECECPYCPTLFNGASWSHELAGLHGLYCTGQLTSEVEQGSIRGGRHAAVRRMVRGATQYAMDKDLADTNAPQHLAVWGQLL